MPSSTFLHIDNIFDLRTPHLGSISELLPFDFGQIVTAYCTRLGDVQESASNAKQASAIGLQSHDLGAGRAARRAKPYHCQRGKSPRSASDGSRAVIAGA